MKIGHTVLILLKFQNEILFRKILGQIFNCLVTMIGIVICLVKLGLAPWCIISYTVNLYINPD